MFEPLLELSLEDSSVDELLLSDEPASTLEESLPPKAAESESVPSDDNSSS